MAWPFRNKASQRLSPEVEKVFDKLWSILQDEPAQVAQYPEPLKSQMMQGADVDQNAMGHGPFGTSLTNPIPANGPIGEILYLSALRIGDKRLLFHRLTSAQAIDVFECCSIDGSHWDLLFLDMYHPRKSRKAADGYQLAQNNVLLSGINREIADFPCSLYSEIVEYSKKRFGISIADPEVRLAIERIRFERPNAHVARLRKVSAGEVGSVHKDLVQELANESLSAQTAIFEQLREFEIPSEKIRLPEITYFVLSLAILSLFRWSELQDAPIMADKLSAHVLKLNFESEGIRVTPSQAIKGYQARFQEYRAALPTSANGDWFSFGLRLSENFIGEKNALIGEILNTTTTVMLVEFKKCIEEIARPK